ncbi:hypothetical protein SERLA73DRAFT_181088 [Serpula lacrymans var. lacrymans S7.3]|uniref:Multiple myeloma tumor-associated protein 2-like N-terminal domain-containing protein n=2 Tax=Serpula lacrymans var. lacrymans TaxID=341189 RepID=F8PUS0_SERL3|nr:uncharacterized protein SERLADRAFT_466975 [Serpula lacrymans var. lacrymans S7.9]EGO00478.1 hypothetical protein SERLA73DRAFT_181088 [Serpula lacrymans var. lacrymans S7.3]EGO26030.1 hypothetical protein SERLADRAFT_466975 [Serpula lacrymans var. lacrymans S7.9]
MFEPIRGGTRGGQAEFKWSDVSADKDRENYLGHSINAPTGRWQKNKDIHWYNREAKQTDAERDEEIRKIKEAEAEALSAALGFAPAAPKIPAESPTAIKLGDEVADTESAQRAAEKEERRRRKAERKEKRAQKEARRVGRAERDLDDTRRYDHSRSRSPRRLTDEHAESRHRSRHSRSPTPPQRGRRSQYGHTSGYDDVEREKERQRDRRRWEMNSQRDRPGARWGRD